MTNEELNVTLYERMKAEQDAYRDWLLKLPQSEILHHCYEYTVREDILLAVEYTYFTDEQCIALLSSQTPLADVYNEYIKRETDYMADILGSIKSRANTVIRRSKLHNEDE